MAGLVDSLRVACLQLSPGADVERNIAAMEHAARAAAAAGARFVCTPEYVGALDTSAKVMRALAMPEAGHRVLLAARALARELKVWFLAGSLTVETGGDKIANRSYLIDDAGEVRASYDKLHMFDVTLANGRTIRESGTYRAGDCACVAGTPFGAVGLTICYDIRFPHLYQALAKAGARIITVPAAFHESGRDIWHVLLRARAIETGAHIVAPAACGEHATGGRTLGHSLIVDPRGRVLADGGAAPGIVMADLDLGESERVRTALPALQHDRDFSVRIT